MAEFNPYQAPQTVASFADTSGGQPFEFGPEFLVVAKGARFCYTAVVTVLVTVVFLVIFGMILGLFGGLILMALPVIFLICAVLHLIGMLMMSKIDPASRAPGLLTMAAVFFGIGFFGGVILIVMQVLKTVGQTPAWVELLQACINLASSVLLLISLKRIGEFVQYPPITRKANSALWGISLMYGILILYTGLTMLAVLGYFPFFANQNNFRTWTSIMGISVLVLGIFALVTYSSALSMIGKLQHLRLALRNSPPALFQLKGDLNIPVPGKEMDFMQ